MADNELAPLPRSDMEAMEYNTFDGNYKTRARSFWSENEIIRIDDTPMKKCKHEFEYTRDGVKCKKCNFGLIANTLEIRDKKLFYKGEPIGF